MTNFWELVNKVIEEADIILEVLDARMIDETRNKEIEDKVLQAGKILVFVINKCDLADKNELERQKKLLRNSVFISATQRLGLSYLREKIGRFTPKKLPPNKKIKIGVLGYPNTGKSTVINALKGHTAAKTSSASGFTKGIQLVRLNQRMYLIDSPGVIPYKEHDEFKHVLIGAKTQEHVKDPELAAMELIGKLGGVVEDYYGITRGHDEETALEDIARKMHKLRKGNEPDTHAAARLILRAWQSGKIKPPRQSFKLW
ncbi:50S ribosome-binding GTPase [Candidatus Woesearchaeota archaeon]|nr:50S ribosome-binding GTPase [Candidatus Woesearchaeota archaeon]